MGLRDGAACELSAPEVVVALGAGEIELALAAEEPFAAGFEERPGAPVDSDRYRQAARLPRDVSGEREQVLALVGERRRFLPPDAAGVDTLLEVHRSAACGIERRIARRDCLHAFSRIAVAGGARAIRSARTRPTGEPRAAYQRLP